MRPLCGIAALLTRGCRESGEARAAVDTLPRGLPAVRGSSRPRVRPGCRRGRNTLGIRTLSPTWLSLCYCGPAGARRQLCCAGHWPRQPGHGFTAAGGEELLPSCSGSFNAFVKEGKYATALNHKTKISFIFNNCDISALMSVTRGY